MEPGGFGHIPDQGDPGAGGQWQASLPIDQKDSGSLGDAPCHLMMVPYLVCGQVPIGVHVRVVGQLGQPCHLFGPGVQVGFVQAALLHGLGNLAHGVVSGLRHLQGGAIGGCGDCTVGAAPIRDHHAVEAPLFAQDVLEQVGILVGIGAVDHVV